MDENGTNHIECKRDFTGASKASKISGQCSINIHLGDSSKENIEQIREIVNGKTKVIDEKPETIEPQVEQFDEGAAIVYVLEAPEISAEDTEIYIDDDYLYIKARSAHKSYEKKIFLNFKPKKTDMQYIFSNGLLRITIAKI